MLFKDLVKFTGTQASPGVFTVTVDSGYNSLPDGVSGYLMQVSDANGVTATGKAVLSGSTLTFEELGTSDLSGFPDYGTGATVTIMSTASGQILNRLASGNLIISAVGQSDNLRWLPVGATNDYDPLLDDALPNVWQLKYQARDSSDVLIDTATDGVYAAKYPLFWQKRSDVSQNLAEMKGNPIVHLANALVMHEGYRNGLILPGARDGSGFNNYWSVGMDCHERWVNMTIEAINLFPNSEFVTFFAGGHSDSAVGMTGATFVSNLQAAKQDRIDRVLAATGVNLTHEPWLFLTMNEVNSGLTTYTDIQNVFLNIDTYLDNAAVINTIGTPQVPGDLYHHPIEVSRSCGLEKGIPSYRTARSRFTFAPILTENAITVAASVGTVGASIITTNQTGNPVTLSGSVGAVTANIVTTNVASSTPLSDAAGATVWHKGTNITSDGNGVSSWVAANDTKDLAQTTNANKPALSSGSIVFTGNHWLTIAEGLINSANGFTIIFDATVDSANGGTLWSDANNWLYGAATTMNYVMGGSGNNNHNVAYDITDSTRHTYALSVDKTGNIARMYVDEVEVDTKALGTYVSGDTAFVLGTLGTYYSTQTVHNMGVINGVAANATTISNIISEFVA